MIPTGIFAIFLVMALIGISIRLVAGSMDRERIEDYIRQRGGRIISVTWSPFGKGWFGEQNARIYEVVYYDGQQNQHMATCKTLLFGGVYFTGDEISHAREPGPTACRMMPPRASRCSGPSPTPGRRRMKPHG